MEDFSDSPFVIVSGDRAFGDFQRSLVDPYLTNVDDDLVQSWDDTMKWIDEAYGLYDDGSGTDRRSPGRLYIVNPDTGGGYANAGGGRVSFHGGAGPDLLKDSPDNQWGLWHEAGHQYQSQQLRWDGLGEVTVNLASLAVQSKRGMPSRLDDAGIQAAYAEHMATPIDQRDFDASDDVWLKLLMFDQLTRAFGDDFYAYLHHEYRARNDRGDELPRTDIDKHDLFAQTASSIAERDLTPFFDAWGISLSAPVREQIATYPALSREIWMDTSRADSVPETILPDYYQCVILGQDCGRDCGCGGGETPGGSGGSNGGDKPTDEDKPSVEETPSIEDKPGIDEETSGNGETPGVDTGARPDQNANGTGNRPSTENADRANTLPTAPTASNGSLARTGVTVTLWAMTAAALVMFGSAALMIRRRSRSE